jgi:hypothetical protein
LAASYATQGLTDRASATLHRLETLNGRVNR